MGVARSVSLNFILCSLLLAACSPNQTTAVSPTATPSPTQSITPTPSAIPSPSPTARPQAILRSPASIYSGPGTNRYRVLGQLSAGTTVFVFGIFGDFVSMSTTAENGGTTGFVSKDALGNLPPALPELTVDQVPLEPILFADCLPFKFDPATNAFAYSYSGDQWRNFISGAIPLDEPIIVSVDELTLHGNAYGDIKVMGGPESQTPWWKGSSRLEIAAEGEYYRLYLRDGASDARIGVLTVPGKTNRPLKVVFNDVQGTSFDVYYAGAHFGFVDVTTVPGLKLPGGLFPKKQIYFGVGTPPNGSFLVQGLTLGNLPSGQWTEPTAPPIGLAKLAKIRNITIGTELSIRDLPAQAYCQIMERDFNVAVLSEFSWTNTWLGRQKYDFPTLDMAVEAAQQHGWRIRASHLVWGARGFLPDWLVRGNYSRDDCIAILKEHIQTIVHRYGDRVQEWSIANEVFSRSLFLHDDFWYQKIGPEYVEMAFRWAREADPDGILLLNDFNNESPRDGRSRAIIDAMYKKVEELKAKGVPIDAVGMQMHILLPFSIYPAPEKDDVVETMRKFGSLGVRIFITEMDIDLTRVPGTKEQKLSYQADVYGEMMEACIESGVCDSFTVWGISDATSWVSSYFHEPNAAPLLFDALYNPKPSYFAIRDKLVESA
jgi:endo-1,4-beta-xylanase